MELFCQVLIPQLSFLPIPHLLPLTLFPDLNLEAVVFYNLQYVPTI